MTTIERKLRLVGELESGEKGIGDQSVSYGLADPADSSLTDWNATILGPYKTNFENRIYSLTLHCDENYPMKPPTVKFITKINIPSVNSTNGVVEPARFSLLGKWASTTTIEMILVALKNEMLSSASFRQPVEGSEF